MFDRVAPLLAAAAHHYNRGELDEAGRLCSRILRMDSRHPQALHLSGLVAMASGNSRTAQELLARAASVQSGPELLVDLAAAMIANGNPRKAIDCCRKALAITPLHAEAHYNLGTAHYRLREFEAAAASLREAVRLKPDFAPARINIGLALRGLGDYSAAQEQLEHVLRINPTDAEALLYCGIVCQDQGGFAKAIAYYERALALKPDSAEILGNMGNTYRDMGDFAKADGTFERVFALAPGYAAGRSDYSRALLARGEFARGWELYESRWEAEGWPDRADYPQPLWNGEPLAGKHLLVWGEQGIGDQIMFASMVPETLEKAASCALACEPKLVDLFARSFPAARVVARGSAAHAELIKQPFDYQVPIGSLARHLRRNFAQFPRHSGYLRADPVKTRAWSERLAALGGGRKIGISWRGGFVGTRRHLRSLDLDAWLPILRISGAEFVSLQYTECAAELEALRSRHGISVHHWQEAIDDYDETAALVCALDSVVSVCTALVHLTGALGRPAWVLVPAVPEWRYMREGERMPWYPSVTLFRQQRVGEWAGVVEQVARRLCE